MNRHSFGHLPHSSPRNRIDDVLADELSAILVGASTRNQSRVATGGFCVSFDHFTAHVDDDPALARRALFGAGFTPTSDNKWAYRAGSWPLNDYLDFDMLVEAVDFHRPV